MSGVKVLTGVVLASLLVSVPDYAGAQVYRWEDQGGTMHFTNEADRVPESYRSQVGPLPPPVEVADEPAPVVPNGDVPAASVAGEEPVAVAPTVTRIPFAPGAPIVVSAKISDSASPVSLILDTGADRTVVAPQALWRLGISTVNAPRAVIKGVTGSGQAEVIQVSSLQVGDAKVGPLRIVAHDADLKQAEGLLGRDFLEHFTVTIDARAQMLILAPK